MPNFNSISAILWWKMLS